METNLTAAMLDKIEQYIKGEMNDADRIAFEALLANNDQLQEEVMLQKQYYSLHQKDWSMLKDDPDNEELQQLKQKLRSSEYQHLSNTIKKAGADYISQQNKPSTFKKYYHYFAYAAVIAIIFTIVITKQNPSLDTYYHDYVEWNTLPSLIEKSQNENNFIKGELAFKREDYTTAITHFNTVTADSKFYVFSLMYLGASYDKLDQNDKAIAAFNQLILTDSIEKSKGYWFKLLIHLKTNNKEKAVAVLHLITANKNNYKYTEALELLKKIEE
ncbi:tetratricopeptide repeat protein [Aquimarina rhabdastrellae]